MARRGGKPSRKPEESVGLLFTGPNIAVAAVECEPCFLAVYGIARRSEAERATSVALIDTWRTLGFLEIVVTSAPACRVSW